MRNDFLDAMEVLEKAGVKDKQERIRLAVELAKVEAMENIAEQILRLSKGITYNADSSVPSISESMVELGDVFRAYLESKEVEE